MSKKYININKANMLYGRVYKEVSREGDIVEVLGIGAISSDKLNIRDLKEIPDGFYTAVVYAVYNCDKARVDLLKSRVLD